MDGRMRPVTDPKILALLNSDYAGGNSVNAPIDVTKLKPVTDPKILALLNSDISRQEQSIPKNTLDKIANNPITNTVLGAGDALSNLMRGTANLMPGVNLPMAKTGEGTAYNVGKI